MKKIFKKFWPLIFIFIIWSVFAGPYFLKNKTTFPSNYQVNSVPPWSYYQKFWGPVKNNAMPDIVGQIYPWRHFSIDMWKKGEIAFWNPYSFSGNPHLANYQSAVFSPFNSLFFIFSFIDAWTIIILLQPLISGIFMYLLMKEMKASRIGSLISSVTFMFCGFLVVWMAYGTLSMAIAFLPLSLLGIEKFYNTKRIRYLFLLSLSIPLSFFSGHFQTSLYFLIFTFIFFIFKSIQTKNAKNTVLIFLSIIFGVIISFIQIIPSIELYLHSVRSEIFITKGNGIPFQYLITSFAPDFFGNPVTRNDWFGYYAEWASFIGIIPLILSLLAITGKKNYKIFFFFVTGFLFLLLAVESPVTAVIGSLKIPVLSTSSPTRIIVLFSFSFAVLAGFGFDCLKELLSKKNLKKIIIPFLIIGVLLLFIWILLLIIKVLPPDKLSIAKRNLFLPTILYSGILIFVLASIKYRMLVLIAAIYLLLAVSFDSLRFVQKWMPADPKDRVFAAIPVISAMNKNIGMGRYFGNLGDQINYYGFQSIEGYDPLYIGRYGEFVQSASKGRLLDAQRSVVRMDRNGKYTDRILDLLGVSLFFHPKADTNKGWAYPVWTKKEKYSLVYEDNLFQLFKNNTAMDRATLFYDYRVIKDSKRLLETFYKDDFDFRNTLLLEEEPSRHAEFSSASQKGEILNQVQDDGNRRTVKIISYTPNKITIKVNTDSPALLFLSDNYYPGWKAYVNNQQTKIYRADYTFRAVAIPQGESTVEFVYKVLAF